MTQQIIAVVCDNNGCIILCYAHIHTNKHAHSAYITPPYLSRLQSAKFMSSRNDSQSSEVMENPYYPISVPADELIHKKVHITGPN